MCFRDNGQNIFLANQDDKQPCFSVDYKQFFANIVKFFHVGKKCRRDRLFRYSRRQLRQQLPNAAANFKCCNNSSFKNSCTGSKMFNHIESDPVKVFHVALDDRLRVSENDDIVVKEEQYKALLVVVVHKKSVV